MCLVYGCSNKIVLLTIKIKKNVLSTIKVKKKKKKKLIDGQDDSGFFKKENDLKDHIN